MDKATFKGLWSPIEGCPAQDEAELFWLVNKVETLKPQTILEIGVARGGTLKYWEQLVPAGEIVMGIEINPEVFNQVEEWWNWSYSNRRIHIVVGDSLDPQIIAQVSSILGTRQIDFLFIDGNHDPEWFFREFVTYGEMVRYGGLIAFHDIRPEMHLQYVFDKIRGRTERFLRKLGIGIYWKEPIDYPLIFQRHDNRLRPFDLDEPQTERINQVWPILKHDRWRQ